MQAAVWTGDNAIELREIPVPQISEMEALIKVWSVGVCTTDLEVYSGMFEYGTPPHILGHEIAGEVVEIGAAVDTWKPGDRVVVETSIGCGHCTPCRNGDRHLCADMTEIGFTPHNGGYAQYVKAPAENLFQIPENVSYDEAGIIESVVCPVGSLMRLGVRFGETVLVYGCGPAAIAFIQGARVMGAGKIIVAGRNPETLVRTKSFGADVLLNTTDEDFINKVMTETSGAGADLVCEAAGSPQTIKWAFETTRRAGRIILYGIPPKDKIIELPTVSVITNQLEVYGTVGNPHVWEPLLKLTSKGRIDLKSMVSLTMPLSCIKEAFTMLKDKLKKPVKIVLHPWDEN